MTLNNFYIRDTNLLVELGFERFEDDTFMYKVDNKFAFITTPEGTVTCTYDYMPTNEEWISENIPIHLLAEWVAKGAIGVI